MKMKTIVQVSALLTIVGVGVSARSQSTLKHHRSPRGPLSTCLNSN